MLPELLFTVDGERFTVRFVLPLRFTVLLEVLFGFLYVRVVVRFTVVLLGVDVTSLRVVLLTLEDLCVSLLATLRWVVLLLR